MIIFLVLIILLIGLIAGFIYLNVNNYYLVNQPQTALQSQGGAYFSPNADYFTLKDSWIELTPGSIGLGSTCYTNITCSSNNCKCNPDTLQCICIPSTPSTPPQFPGFTEPSVNESNTITNYGQEYLYSAICAQQSNSTQFPNSYYPDFKSKTLINENLVTTNFENTCSKYTFQQTPIGDITCYDTDQLAGTKIVEFCQATANTNEICINNDGDRVYAPSLNSLYIKPSLTLCEDNTTISYISFNFNNTPQTIETLVDTTEGGDDGKPLYDNQILCLSVDTVSYYPNLTVNIDNQSSKTLYYVTFTGSWGFQYSYIYDVSVETISSALIWYDTANNEVASDDLKAEIVGRLSIDTATGIVYNVPIITIAKDSSGFILSNSRTKNKIFTFGVVVDVVEQTTYEITSSLSLKPCAAFDTSYTDSTLLQDLKGSGYIDKQKFKVSRYTTTKGALSPDPEGMVSSIVYRNLNYENGGLYLDYFTPFSLIIQGTNKASGTFTVTGSTITITDIPDADITKLVSGSGQIQQGIYTATGTFTVQASTNTVSVTNISNINGFVSNTIPNVLKYVSEETLVLRKINPKDLDSSRLWILIPPQNLSPYTIPSGNNMWCNYCQDSSTDGGNTFNGKNAIAVPMNSNQLSEGTEIIDPVYNQLAKQPDNKLFNIAGNIIEAAGAGLSGIALTGVEVYELVKHKQSFHLLNNDPSFSKCAQLCSKSVPFGFTPKVKAVAVNSGTLGSIPPGHSRGITTNFSQGTVIDGISIGSVTCQAYYLYNNNGSSPSIASREVGDSYVDGNVEFIIESTYNNTYMFETSYFNNKGNIVISSVSSPGSGYGLTTPPKNVISGFSNISTPNLLVPSTLQKFVYNIPTGTPSSTTTPCTLTTPTTSLCTISTTYLKNSELCVEDATGKNILDVVTGYLNNEKWSLNVGNSVIPVKITFSSSVCNNSTMGLENFYNIISARVNFDIQKGSLDNTVQIPPDTKLSTFFPVVTDTSVTSYKIFNEKTSNTLYDSSGNPMELTVSYGEFVREYRLYYQKTYVATVNISNAGNNGSIQSTGEIEIVELVDEVTILNNINADFTLQEWWILETQYGNTTIDVEYQNTSAKDCVIKIVDKTSNWSILNPAPKDLIGASTDEDVEKSDPLLFYDASQPIDLSNNSVLRNGSSPQQIVYSGSFQEDNEYCYATYPQDSTGGTFVPDPNSTTEGSKNQQNFTKCNSDSKCSFNENLGYCTGKNLIELSSDTFGTDVFTTTQSFNSQALFNFKNEENDLFTNLTFLKSLQIPNLNYRKYNAMPSQTVEGSNPTYYYTPPNFINYNNQGISTSDVTGLTLGKFIPYQYLYPNFKVPEIGTESSMIQDKVKINKQIQSVNNFYINMNYAQFIPYGKKSLYENGFTKQSDVPTF